MEELKEKKREVLRLTETVDGLIDRVVGMETTTRSGASGHHPVGLHGSSEIHRDPGGGSSKSTPRHQLHKRSADYAPVEVHDWRMESDRPKLDYTDDLFTSGRKKKTVHFEKL